jgi:hypothetical protein
MDARTNSNLASELVRREPERSLRVAFFFLLGTAGCLSVGTSLNMRSTKSWLLEVIVGWMYLR